MRRVVPCLGALVLFVGMGQAGRANAAMTFAHLTLDSSPGSFIGGGQNWDITYTPANTNGFFNANILTFDNVNGQPAFIRFSFLQLSMNPDNFATLDFATNQLGIPIAVGTYDQAERASFASPGHPGLDVTLQHRGANTLTGSFTVTDVSFYQDTSGALTIGHFATTFEEFADNNTSHFTGTFEYNDSNAPAAVPEPSSVTLLGLGTLGLLGYVWRRRKQAAA